MHRSVAKIIFWLHDHMPRAHNIHVMYNFEHNSSQVAAEWGVCVVIADVHHSVKNTFFHFCAKNYWHYCLVLLRKHDLLILSVLPKKCISHSDINYFFFFQPLLSTFLAHLLALSHIYKTCRHKNKHIHMNMIYFLLWLLLHQCNEYFQSTLKKSNKKLVHNHFLTSLWFLKYRCLLAFCTACVGLLQM